MITMLLGTMSCQDESQILDLSSVAPNVDYPMVDPNTPKDAQPYILHSNQEGSRVQSLPTGSWTQVWSDEFDDGTTLNTNKWNRTVSTVSRGLNSRDPALNWWGFTADNVWQDNGKLYLASHKVASDRLECGSVDSKNKYMTTFGYFETKIKIIDPELGSHTAFWFYIDSTKDIDNSGTDGAEIDVFESVWTDNTTSAIVHIDGYGADKKPRAVRYHTPNLATGFHVFGLEWDPGFLKIYYDGVHKATFRGAYVPMVEEFIWLSVGASFGYENSPSGSGEGTRSGADGFSTRAVGSRYTAEVEYFRVWKSDNTPYYRIKNRETRLKFKVQDEVDDALIIQSPNSQVGDWTLWTIEPTEKGYFYFVNKGTGKYFRPSSSSNNSQLVQKPNSFGGAWTQWKFTKPEGDASYYYLKNRETGKYIAPESTSSTADILLQPTSVTDNWTQWQAIKD